MSSMMIAVDPDLSILSLSLKFFRKYFFQLSFDYTFDYDLDSVYFAYSIPYTYSMLWNFLLHTSDL